MSIVGVILAAIFIAIGVWITSQSDVPQPVKWIVFAVLIIICILATLKLLGIDLGHA